MEDLQKTLVSRRSTGQSKHGRRRKGNKQIGMKIIIASFAIFGLIILTEILVIDECMFSTTSRRAIPWGELLSPIIEHTLPSYRNDVLPSDGSWKIVNGTRFKFFVFSAFYDRREGKRLVRVIGATKTRGPDKVWCRLWYPIGPNKSTFRSSSVMARVKMIRENWKLKYSACFILCPLEAPGLEIPYAVSIVSKIRSPPGNFLLVRSTDHDLSPQIRTSIDQIGVCIKPFHYNYDSALSLLEFFEMYSLLGVSHFTFYNHTLGPKVDCVLRHYIEEGLASADNAIQDAAAQRPTVSMLPWDLRMQSQKEIRTEGMFAALNDCLYRSMYRFQYVAFIDVDEFMVPRHNNTLKDLLKWLSPKGNKTGSYSFQNAFFYLQFADDSRMYKRNVRNPALRSALITQRKTRRRLELHRHGVRSKYICKPELVVEVGNHFIWEYMPEYGPLKVPNDSAILQHYRVCEFGGDDCVKGPSIVDRAAHKYSRRLTDRVEILYSKLKATCELPDLPPVLTRGVKDLKRNIKNWTKLTP